MFADCSLGVEFSFDDAPTKAFVRWDDDVLVMLSEERDNTPLPWSEVGNNFICRSEIACSALQLRSKLERAASISSDAGSNL
jgi:hypothetical protein